MKEFTCKVMLAVAPVFGVCVAIAVLQAAHVPFPPALSLQAWPQWVVFASVIHTCTALWMFTAGRIFGEPASSGPATPHTS